MNSSIGMLAAMLPGQADAALIISGENRRYFTGFVSSAGYLLVTRNNAYLFVDFRYAEAAKSIAAGCEVISFSDFGKEFAAVLQKENVKSLLYEGSAFTLSQAARIDEILTKCGAEGIRSDDADRCISKLRIIKTAHETEKIITAQRITEQALKDTLKLVREGVAERDLALELEYRMRKLGADGISFDLIVIAGQKTSMPHGVPGENRIRPGDFITFDIGALYRGYHSDMTRTYAYGYVNDKQKRIYSVVKQAQQLALDAVKAGVRCCDVDKAAREYIYHAGFEGCFGHSTGHGVGLEIHEQPFVSSKNENALESGMVITVEPGVYLPGEFGVRIEDMVTVTSEGCINLATLSKELTIL